jgi:hypothetical protein
MAAMAYFDEHGTFRGFDVAAAEAMEPSVAWVIDGQVPVGIVSIRSGFTGSDGVMFVARNSSGPFLCVTLRAPEGGGGFPYSWDRGDSLAQVDEAAECNMDDGFPG